MAPGIDMSDRNAWDDTFLINSWNDAVKEYERYHSIHKSGKRLEEALSEEELKELRRDYGELIEETESAPGATVETNGGADQSDTEMGHAETNGVKHVDQPRPQQQETSTPVQEQQGPTADVKMPATHEESLASSMPQAILGTVKDENLKNIMMSWYYAGYYTGLHAGQQQGPPDTKQ